MVRFRVRTWLHVLKMTYCVGHLLLLIVTGVQSAETFHHPNCFSSIMSLGGAAWTFGQVGRAPIISGTN